MVMAICRTLMFGNCKAPQATSRVAGALDLMTALFRLNCGSCCDHSRVTVSTQPGVREKTRADLHCQCNWVTGKEVLSGFCAVSPSPRVFWESDSDGFFVSAQFCWKASYQMNHKPGARSCELHIQTIGACHCTHLQGC